MTPNNSISSGNENQNLSISTTAILYRKIGPSWPISLAAPDTKWPPFFSNNLKYKSLNAIESISAISDGFR